MWLVVWFYCLWKQLSISLNWIGTCWAGFVVTNLPFLLLIPQSWGKKGNWVQLQLRWKISPDWCGSVGWVSQSKLWGHQFGSQSGHRPGLQARFPAEGVWKATNQSVSLSLSLCLSQNQFWQIKKRSHLNWVLGRKHFGHQSVSCLNVISIIYITKG